MDSEDITDALTSDDRNNEAANEPDSIQDQKIENDNLFPSGTDDNQDIGSGKDQIFETESESLSPWKEHGFSSEVTQDSQTDYKKYSQSSPSNEEESLSNATQSQLSINQNQDDRKENIIEGGDAVNTSQFDTKVKSVIKLSASMHSNIQESMALGKNPSSLQDVQDPTPDVAQVYPDNTGFFTFPHDKNQTSKYERRIADRKSLGEKGHFQRKLLSQKQFFKRVQDRQVLVISVFGRSTGIDSGGEKAFIFDELMKKDVFNFRLIGESDSESSDDSDSDFEFVKAEKKPESDLKTEPFIEGYHDEVNGRIYLHMRGNFDSTTFSKKCMQEKMNEKDLHTFFSENKYTEAKLLLFLFHVSHLLVCYHEQPSLDFNYINLFQTLDFVRAKLHSSLGSEISKKSQKFDLPKDVINHGRFCIPKLVFYFATSPMALRGKKGSADLIKRDGKISKNPPIRKLEFSIEDQIFRIFRRVKLISSTSATSCLFSIPSRDGFVYVDNRENTKKGTKLSHNRDSAVDQLFHTYRSTLSQGQNTNDEDSISSDTSDSENSLDLKCNGLTLGMPYSYQHLVSNDYGKSHNPLSKKYFTHRSFSKFLLTHIDFLTKRAEKVSGDGEDKKSIYELPSSHQWYYGASCIFKLFGSSLDKLGSSDDVSSATPGFVRANSILGTKTSFENRFSESRCAKALPNAISAYKEGLQPHYLQDYHQAKLLQAVTLYSHQSRGPSSKKYAELLVEECNAYWQAGRQMCEELSLTGNNCNNRKHLVPSPSETTLADKNKSDSENKTNSACDTAPNGKENIEEIECTSTFEGNVQKLLHKLSNGQHEVAEKLLNELDIDSESKLNMCIENLFESAILSEHVLIASHAQICEALRGKDLSTINMNRLHVKRLLVARCQQEFEKSFKELETFANNDQASDVLLNYQEELTDKDGVKANDNLSQERALGIVIFCGELYKLNILTKTIMYDCIGRMLQNAISIKAKVQTSEIWLGFVCKLLTNIGKELDNDGIPRTKGTSFESIIKEMYHIIERKSCTSKARVVVEELVHLRKNNWAFTPESEVRRMTEKIAHDESSHPTSDLNGGNAKCSKKNLPTIPHRSAITFLSSCNCGRRQVNRDDPFALIEANFRFYAELEDECCADLEHIQVPYYRDLQHATKLDTTVSHPSLSSVLSTNPKEDKYAESLTNTSVELTSETFGNMSIAQIDGRTMQEIPEGSSSKCAENMQLPTLVEETSTSDRPHSEIRDDCEKKSNTDTINADEKISKNQESNVTDSEVSKEGKFSPDFSALDVSKCISSVSNVVGISNENREKLQSLMNRQCSSSESVTGLASYHGIPHMITTSTGAEKLPLFPSWALTQLGSSSVYAHSSGVTQTGFISNNRNLLPWDVPLKNTDWQTLQKKWPNIAESAIKKSSFNPSGKGVDMGLTVKVFVGLEYECHRGHRLIASSPGRTKSMTSSITNRMVNSDAPLYIECHCTKGSSSAHPVISQLMRIHIVTPKAPMHITLNPRVIPCPDGPTFHPGWHSQKLSDANTTDGRSSETSNHIRLPISTYWVLRLPFIYWGEGGSHLPPKEVPDASYGRLLKGFIGITEDYSYR